MALNRIRNSVEFKIETDAANPGPTSAASETTLISSENRTSIPIVVAWWRNYRRNADKVVCDEDGTYRCIKQDQSPPPEEIELSTSVESCTSPVYHFRVSRNAMKRSLLELMKSTNSAGIAYLEDIEKGKMSPEEAEKIFSTRPDVEKNIALLCAALNSRVDLLKVFLEIKADIHCTEPTEGFTALHFSAVNDDVKCAAYLIESGADVNYAPEKYTALETACFHNASSVAKLLLDNGAEINTNVSKESSSREGTYQGNPLHSAVKANSIDCVQLLLAEAISNIKEKKDSDYSPLHVAAEMGHLQCLKIILDAGIDPNLVTPDTRSTPLHFAAEGGFNECVSVLLSKGAKADVRNLKGLTPLHLAARVHSVECVDLLLDGHCSPNMLDCDKKSPLHSAVGKALNSSDIVDSLIQKGANVNQEDIYGYTPLHIAAINENTPCVQILINNGANVTKKTKGGNTALGIIIRKTPLALPVLYKKLDNAIMVHDPEVSSSKEVLMKLDFRIFLQHCQKGEMDFLTTFLDEGQKEILEHPLCQAFLHIKWEKILAEVRQSSYLRTGWTY